uniref:Uncharacterized protein n=1 Tax=Cucumis melo TaxID=3656 RepID=A0A9I9EG15_CUCME
MESVHFFSENGNLQSSIPKMHIDKRRLTRFELNGQLLLADLCKLSNVFFGRVKLVVDFVVRDEQSYSFLKGGWSRTNRFLLDSLYVY